MSNVNLDLIIVCCTKEDKEGFKNTKLAQSLKRFETLPFLKQQIFYNNSQGLSARYNQAIKESVGKNCVFVFVHDDVEIVDHFWFHALGIGLGNFDLVGVAGSTRHITGATSWCVVGLDKKLDEPQYFSGAVMGGDGQKMTDWHICAPVPLQCVSLDGVFLGARNETFLKNNLWFDEQFEFHHYDTDISRQFVEKGLKIGTWPISIVHHAAIEMEEDWRKSAEKYLAKWQQKDKEKFDFDVILKQRRDSCLDMHEHFPVLRKLASECKSVTEMGVRAGCSIWALAAGLNESAAEVKSLTYIDIQPVQNPYLEEVCKAHQIETQWIQGDTKAITISICDLLLIDTLHTYKQLGIELRKHHTQVNKYIVMHDTEAPWGFKNELNDHSEKEGLRPAIDDFLKEFGHQWEQFAHYTNCNGLTVLKRKID